MFEIVMDALEILPTDTTVNDVLTTVGATATTLADKVFSPAEFIAFSVVIKAAEKRIQEITQSKQ